MITKGKLAIDELIRLTKPVPTTPGPILLFSSNIFYGDATFVPNGNIFNRFGPRAVGNSLPATSALNFKKTVFGFF